MSFQTQILFSYFLGYSKSDPSSALQTLVLINFYELIKISTYCLLHKAWQVNLNFFPIPLFSLRKQDRFRPGVAKLVLGIAVLRSSIYLDFLKSSFFSFLILFHSILFHFILFHFLVVFLLNHPVVVFLYNELRHTHKQTVVILMRQ